MADATFLIEIIVKARRELAGVMEKAARDIDKVTGAEERHAKSTKKVTDATNTTNKAVADLNKSFDKYTKELEAGNRSTDEAAEHLKRFGREFDKLANRAEAGSDVADSLLKAAKAARKAADEVENTRKRQAAQIEESYKQAAQIDKAYTELNKTRAANAKKAADEEEIGLKKRQAFVLDILQSVNEDEARRSQERIQIARAEQEDFDRVQAYRLESMSAADKKIEQEAQAHQAKIKQIEKVVQGDAAKAEKIRTDGLKARQKLEKEIATAQQKFQLDSIEAQGREKLANLEREHSQRNLRDEIDETIRSYDDFIDRVRQGDVRGSQVKVGLQQHAQALGGVTRRATNTFGAGSDDSLHVGGREVEARSLIKGIGRESSIATPRVVGFGSAIQRIFNVDTNKADAIQASIDKTEDALGKASFQAIHFAGVLRSLVYVGAIVFFQELTSAAVALAGAMVAVASTAVQAGGALVGALTAGAAQALPVIGLLGAAWGRVGAVFDAVKQNIKQQTQAGYEQVQAAKAQTDAAVRLTAAQEALSAAQKQAKRDIEDLQAAQRSAQLQAERSILSQSDAQVALTSALRTGDVGSVASLSLRTRETSFDASQARTNLFRSTADAREATSQGVKGRPNVVAARRELEAAKRAADDAADSVSAADRTLQQMLADLSPAERRLYEALNRVVTKYRQVFTGEGGILESITDAFTFGADRVLKLFDDSRLVEAARKLADSIATQLRRAFSELSGKGTRSFVADLADDARRNLPLITELAVQVGKIVGVIVKAGGPALTRFLDFFVNLATQGAKATGSGSALEKLTDFFLKGEEYAEDIAKLAIAVAQLIAAVVGTAAPEGQTAIEQITDAVQSATQYINENKDGVKQFFHDAVEASGFVAGAIVALSKALFGFFHSDQVKTFANAFTRTFLPAIVAVLQVVGVLTNVFLKFAGTGAGSALFQFLIMTTGLVKVLGPLIGLFARLARGISALLGLAKVVGFFNGFLGLLGPIGLAIGVVGSALILLDGKFHIFQKFGDLFKSAADKSREAADKFTDAINRQIDALRRQRDAELARQGSRLALSRAEIAAQRSRAEAAKVGGIDLDTGAVKKGVEVTDARRDASLNLKQALLDEKQARIDLADARKTDEKAGADAVGQSKKTLDASKDSVKALKDERAEIEKKIDRDKDIIATDKKLLDTLTPGTDKYRFVTSQLAEAQADLQTQNSKLKDNTKDLRSEADRATDSFRRWRTAVKRAGSNTESFSDDVHSAMDSVVSDVNEVLVEFGAKPLKWKSSAKKTPTQKLSGASEIFDTPDIGGFPGRQQGGMAPSIIPGSGDGDKVHVMAEPGEGFINKTAVKALGGPRVIDWINNKLAPRFQRGGIVQIPGSGGNGQGVDSRILGDVVSLIRKFKALVTAGYAPTGHKAAGEHPLGLAVDLVPNTAAGGTWDDIDKLAHYAEPSQNNPRPPWRWVGYDGDAGHGRGNHLHLSWLHEGLKTVETLRGAAGLAFEVAKRKITGPVGALTNLFQGASDKVTKAANAFLAKKTESSEFSGGAAGSGTEVLLGEGGPGKRIFDYFVAQGFSRNQAAAWVGNAVQESGLSPKAIENNGKGPGHGLFQWSFGRYEALLAYARKRGTDWDDEQTQLDFTMHELGSSEHAAYSRIKAAKTLAAAVAAIGQGYERFGVEGNRLGPAEAALKAYGGGERAHGGSFADGGVVPGNEGRPINIVAHAGEWVLNKVQQGRLAASVFGRKAINAVDNDDITRNIKKVWAAFQKITTTLGAMPQIKTSDTYEKGYSGSYTPKTGVVELDSDIYKSLGDPSRGNFDEALQTLIHEFAHSRQDDSVIKDERLSEGGAERFTRWASSVIAHMAHLQFGGYFDVSDYGKLVAWIDKNKTPKWWKHDQFKTQLGPPAPTFATGGEVDGPVGKAVNIVAHAKEWVVNQSQQGKLAAMLGTSVHGLRSMLGFSGGPTSFAGGGEVEFNASQAAARAAHAQAVATATAGRPTPNVTGDVKIIIGEVNKASSVIAKLKSSLINSKFTDKLSLAIKQMAGEGGLLDVLSTTISDFSDRLSTNLSKLAFKFDKAGNIIKGLTPGETASKSLDNLQRVYAALVGEKGAIQKQIVDIAKRLKDSKLSSGDRALLESTKTNLDKRLQDVQGLINQSLADQFQGVEDVIQASVDAAQNQHDDSTFRSTIQARLRAIAGNDLSAVLGLPTPGQIAKVQADALNVQANNVANAARTAQRAGHSDTAKALLKTVEDLRVQALELVTQGIRDDVAVIDAQASRRQARIDLSGRAADLLERVGNTAGAFALRGRNLQNIGANLATQRTGLLGELGAAQATGNGALVEELTDRIADLDQSIAENVVALQENTTAARAAAINEITQRGSNLGGIFSGVSGIFSALGDLTGTTNTAGITEALKSAGTVLKQTGSGLAQKLFEGFGIDLRNLDPQSIANKLLGTDFDSVTANLSPGDKSQFFDLINSIIDNTTATVGNTKQLNDIVSPTAQSFSSTAWTNFRRAIFNGAGGLIPKFDMAVPSLAGGGDIIRGGLVEVHNSERVLTAAQVKKSFGSGPGGDTINVAVTHPVERFDPVDGARQMVHEFRKKKGGGA